jgi:predicted PurR-regulated permease PerM
VTNNIQSRLEQNLGWFILFLLAAGCVLVMMPFVSALVWAVVLTFSTWPLYRRLLALVGNRRTLAALLMSLALMLVILLPVVVVGA